MKIRFLILAFFAATIAACSGGTDNSADAETTANTETEVTAEDLKSVEETEAVKEKAAEATSKVDSILNTL